MFQQPPPTEDQISELPLDLVLLTSEHERESFTDELITIWIELAESGSLATLPPVPDIVGFVDDCAAFYLIYHTNLPELKSPPGAVAETPSPQHDSASRRGSPSKGDSSGDNTGNAKDEEEPPSYFDVSTIRGVIGCVYLSFSSATQNTVDIGIALRPEARGRGYGRAALAKASRHAFETLNVHRIVANIFGSGSGQSNADAKASAKESGTVRWVFEKLGFTPEGVNRRAGFSATDGVWRDVHVLALLDTDWMQLQRRGAGRSSITTPWDSMMERHEKERDEMMEWMDDPSWGRLRRVASTETIKGATETDQDCATDELGDSTTTAGASGSGKGKAVATERIYVDVDADSDASDPFGSTGSLSDYKSTPSISEPQTPGSPAPSSSLGFSPPASVVSLPSDFDWRSVGQSSQPSEASATPSYASSHASWSQISPPPPAGAQIASPPIFSLDEDDELIDFSHSGPE